VEALQPLLDLAGDDFGIRLFALNIVGGTAADKSSVSGLPTGWKARNERQVAGFGRFDLHVVTAKNSNVVEPLLFSITGVDFDTILSYVDLSTGRAPEGLSLFAARVVGLNIGSCGRITPHTAGGDGESGGYGGGYGGGEHGGGGYGGGDYGNGDCGGAAFIGGGIEGPVVPAPAGVWLLGTALAALGLRRRLRA
jgi:hypothetical protein